MTMTNTAAIRFFCALCLLVSFASPQITLARPGALTQDTTKKTQQVFPVPPTNPNRLFYLQRTSNTNTIVYDVNIDPKTGKPDTDKPVIVYWLLYTDKGQRSEMTYIQRKFAYGVNANQLGGDKYDIRIVSNKKIPLTLMRGADGKYHIFASIAQKLLMLNKIFINIEGGSLWLPNVVYVEMKGTDPATGKEITERFKP